MYVELREQGAFRYQKIGATKVKVKVETGQWVLMCGNTKQDCSQIGYVQKKSGNINLIINCPQDFIDEVVREINKVTDSYGPRKVAFAGGVVQITAEPPKAEQSTAPEAGKDGGVNVA